MSIATSSGVNSRLTPPKLKMVPLTQCRQRWVSLTRSAPIAGMFTKWKNGVFEAICAWISRNARDFSPGWKLSAKDLGKHLVEILSAISNRRSIDCLKAGVGRIRAEKRFEIWGKFEIQMRERALRRWLGSGTVLRGKKSGML
jgi:hypothetical protein